MRPSSPHYLAMRGALLHTACIHPHRIWRKIITKKFEEKL
jgi:hypothetical protein